MQPKIKFAERKEKFLSMTTPIPLELMSRKFLKVFKWADEINEPLHMQVFSFKNNFN